MMADDAKQVYYCVSENLFIDECGFAIHNIIEMIGANMLYLFKKKKDDMFIYGLNGEFIEMIYEQPDYSYEEWWENILKKEN